MPGDPPPPNTRLLPKFGTKLEVPADHYFYFPDSTVPAMRVMYVEGKWTTVDPKELQGLIVFLTRYLTHHPKNVVILSSDPTTAYAEEVV